MLISQERIPIREIILCGFLPGPLKKLVYRLRGYRIGKNVSIGLGAVICGKEVSVGEHSRIGFLTIIRGERINIGPFVHIGATTFLDTPHLEIGEGSRINEQVFVGGLQYPDSRLTLGKNCQIMQRCFINPTRSITVGDDSGIGGDCLVFGHTSWLSQFEGYTVDFAPIEIGKSVSVAWRVFILPGSRIGDGAVIGANSLVHRTIPPRCLAVGFPAKVVSSHPVFPRELSGEEKEQLLRRLVEDMLSYFSGHGLKCEGVGNDTYAVRQVRSRWWGTRERKYRLGIAYSQSALAVDGVGDRPFDVLLSLQAIPDGTRATASARRIMWIDIERKERSYHGNDLGEEVALFLKRYGIRLTRVGR